MLINTEKLQDGVVHKRLLVDEGFVCPGGSCGCVQDCFVADTIEALRNLGLVDFDMDRLRRTIFRKMLGHVHGAPSTIGIPAATVHGCTPEKDEESESMTPQCLRKPVPAGTSSPKIGPCNMDMLGNVHGLPSTVNTPAAAAKVSTPETVQESGSPQCLHKKLRLKSSYQPLATVPPLPSKETSNTPESGCGVCQDESGHMSKIIAQCLRSSSRGATSTVSSIARPAAPYLQWVCDGPKEAIELEMIRGSGLPIQFWSKHVDTSPGAGALDLARLLHSIANVFSFDIDSVGMFDDPGSSMSAFNFQGHLFFNMAFFRSNRHADDALNASIFWWVVFVHELAHNAASGHGLEHGRAMEYLIMHSADTFFQDVVHG